MWHSFKWALTSLFTLKHTSLLGEITPASIWTINLMAMANGLHCMKKEKMGKHLRIFSDIFWCEIDG